VTGKNVGEVARAVKVSRQTVSTWRSIPEFREALETALGRLLAASAILRSLLGGQGKTPCGGACGTLRHFDVQTVTYEHDRECPESRESRPHGAGFILSHQ
jgi:hypothetical protein